jgi:hypothetical protein
MQIGKEFWQSFLNSKKSTLPLRFSYQGNEKFVWF